MTERPTEQTQSRLTGLDAPAPEASAGTRTSAPSAPTLPPMPPAADQERTPLAERLQQRLSSVRQAERGTNGTNGTAPANGTATDPTASRPAAQASTTTAPVAPSATAPVLPPPVPQQEQAQPAPRQRTRPTRAAKAKRPPRRARLRLTRIDPWSVMKTAFLLSIALGVVTIVSVLMVWSVLGAAGVWDSINTTVRDIVGDQSDTPFTIQNYLGTDRVIGFTMLVAVIDVVLMTAIATLAAFLYNMAAALLGGIEITLAEDEH